MADEPKHYRMKAETGQVTLTGGDATLTVRRAPSPLDLAQAVAGVAWALAELGDIVRNAPGSTVDMTVFDEAMSEVQASIDLVIKPLGEKVGQADGS